MNKLDKLFCHSATFNSKISSESILKIKNTPTDKCKVMIIDIGTTNTKVKLYDHQHRVISSQNHRTQIHSPEENSSEIEPLNLWNNVASLCRNSLEELSLSASDITCMGLTTQRESFLIWNKLTGEPLHNIITWQDRRAVEICEYLNSSKQLAAYKYICQMTSRWTANKSTIHSGSFRFSPNMSVVRLYYLLQKRPELYSMLASGEAVFGTVDSWIAYNLTERQQHITDYANASITGLFDPIELCYHPKIMYFLGLTSKCFPSLVKTHGILFETSKSVFGSPIPVTCMIGDQQASTLGCGCTDIGSTKATLGTGLFINTFIGSNILPQMGDFVYPLLAWAFNHQSPLYLYETRSDFAQKKLSEGMANENFDCMATLDKIIYSNAPNKESKFISKKTAIDLLNENIFTFHQTWQRLRSNLSKETPISCIKVDGGYSTSDYLLQGISSLINTKIIRMKDTESTSKGAYVLARLGAGLNKNSDEFADILQGGKVFKPDPMQRKLLLDLFHKPK